MAKEEDLKSDNDYTKVILDPEGVTRELGGRADNGLRPYPSLIKVAFMGGQIG